MAVSLEHKLRVLSNMIAQENKMRGLDNCLIGEPDSDQEDHEESDELELVYEKLWRSNLRVRQLENALIAIVSNDSITSWLAKNVARQALENNS